MLPILSEQKATMRLLSANYFSLEENKMFSAGNGVNFLSRGPVAFEIFDCKQFQFVRSVGIFVVE